VTVPGENTSATLSRLVQDIARQGDFANARFAANEGQPAVPADGVSDLFVQEEPLASAPDYWLPD
jgi:hypothetical protein